MRIFNELNGRNQGVYLVREMIRKRFVIEDKVYLETNSPTSFYQGKGLLYAMQICNDLLDIATLGEIEERREYDLEKEN